MRPLSLRRALTGAFVAAGLLVGGWIGLGEMRGVASVFDPVETLTLDWRFLLAGPRMAPDGVVVVAIDDETLSDASGHALSRALMAKIVLALAASHPRVVALDFAFPDAKEGDAELANALRATPSVVAAIGLFGESAGTAPRAAPELALTAKPTRCLWPTQAIADAAFGIGLANVSTDRSGVPRYIPMLFTIDDGVAPSLALAAASTAAGEDPIVADDAIVVQGRTIRLDLGYHLPLRFYGPSRSFRRISAADLIGGAADPATVRGKIVVLGMTATGLADTFATPFDRVTPGVDVLATAIGNPAGGDRLVRGPATRRIDAATTALLPVAVLGLLALRRAAVGFAAVGLVLAVWAAAVYVAFLEGFWLAVAAPLSLALALGVAFAAARIVVERAEGGRLAAEKSALAKFHSPLLIDRIASEPDFLAKPVRQEAAVLFLDLTGSTGVSEALGPEWSRDMLKTMQTLVEGALAAHRGVVINYMGDGVLAAFGLPAPEAGDARRALAAVERLAADLSVWIAGLPAEATGRLDFRIGAHFGPAIVSRLGSPDHQQITLAGDTVNAASRLLEVAKERHCRIVVTEDLVRAARAGGDEAFDLSGYEAATVPIRGRAASLEVRMRR